MAERIFYTELQDQPEELLNYAGIEFPEFLITRDVFGSKMKRINELMSEFKKEMAEGTPSGDTGDTHGQYHNELAWYREQSLSSQADLIENLGRGLDEAIIIESYEQVKSELQRIGINNGVIVTLGSHLEIQFGEDTEDIEDITIVAPLDSGSRKGWISTESPLAKAVEGKRHGDKTSFTVKGNRVEVTIL